MSEHDERPQTQESLDEGEKLVLNTPEQAGTLKDFALWAGVIALAVLTAFSPALRGEFLWDDNRHVTENRALESVEGLGRIWFKLKTTPQYYPLTHTTYWLEYQIAGRESAIFHVTNALIHAGAAILLWFVLRQLRAPGAWVAAAIWAIHPMQTESAAWISERKNVLSAALMFASLLAYLVAFKIGDERESEPQGPFPRDRYLLALALFLAAMLSKTVACSLPAVILLLIWWKRGRVTGRDILPLMPFFVIGLALAGLTAYLERTHVGARGADWNLTIAERILIAGRAIWFYAGKTLWPTHLAFIYHRWSVSPAAAWQWLYPLGVLIVPAALFAARKQIGRGPLAAALVYCGVLVPALGFFNVYPMRYSFVADHFQYHAGPALIALVVALAAKVLERVAAYEREMREPQSLPLIASAVVLIVLSVLTFRRSHVFSDMISLWRDTVIKTPDAWIARYNLGKALYDDAARPSVRLPEETKKMVDEALVHLQRATELRSSHDRAYNYWGLILLDRGEAPAAMEKFRQALAINPDNFQAMTNLGRTLAQQKKLDEAIEFYRRALDVAAKDPAVGPAERSIIHRYLGEASDAKGDLSSAAAEFHQAVRLDPSSQQTRFLYGTLLARQEKRVDAASQFGTIIRMNPTHMDARISLALLQVEVGNLRDARENLTVAAQINRQHPRLEQAAQIWADAYKAATQPATTRSATQTTTRPATTDIAR